LQYRLSDTVNTKVTLSKNEIDWGLLTRSRDFSVYRIRKTVLQKLPTIYFCVFFPYGFHL